MKIGTKGTLNVGSDKYALQVIEMVNKETAVAVHIEDDGTCFQFDDGFPWVEILKMDKDGRWFRGECEFVIGECINYSNPSF